MPAKTEKVKWVMPAWMEPYRNSFVNTGGNGIEELMDDYFNDKRLAQHNEVRFLLAVAVSSQVGLLACLHADGRL